MFLVQRMVSCVWQQNSDFIKSNARYFAVSTCSSQVHIWYLILGKRAHSQLFTLRSAGLFYPTIVRPEWIVAVSLILSYHEYTYILRLWTMLSRSLELPIFNTRQGAYQPKLLFRIRSNYATKCNQSFCCRFLSVMFENSVIRTYTAYPLSHVTCFD